MRRLDHKDQSKSIEAYKLGKAYGKGLREGIEDYVCKEVCGSSNMAWQAWHESHRSLSEDIREDIKLSLDILSEAYDIVDQRINIKKIIVNSDATIVLWEDESKTVVKRMEGDSDDIYSAVAQALAKKLYYNSTTSFHRIVDQKLVYQPEKKKEDK